MKQMNALTIAPTSNPKNGTEWRDLLEETPFGLAYAGEARAGLAPLLASAPELLAALEAIAAQFDGPLNDMAYRAHCDHIARAAIAKAKGLA